MRKRLFILFIFFQLVSCIGSSHIKESEALRIITGVPYYPQESFRCGPASLAGVLNYWGIKVQPEEIAREIFSPSAGGTLNLDMILYTQKKGLKAIPYKGSIEDIKLKIDSGFPIIVLVDLGFWLYQQNHFMVIVGYYEKGIIVNSGSDHLKRISFNDFIKTWRKTNFWTLLINP